MPSRQLDYHVKMVWHNNVFVDFCILVFVVGKLYGVFYGFSYVCQNSLREGAEALPYEAY